MTGFQTVVEKVSQPWCGRVVGSVHVATGHEKSEKIRFFMNILLNLKDVAP